MITIDVNCKVAFRSFFFILLSFVERVWRFIAMMLAASMINRSCRNETMKLAMYSTCNQIVSNVPPGNANAMHAKTRTRTILPTQNPVCKAVLVTSSREVLTNRIVITRKKMDMANPNL